MLDTREKRISAYTPHLPHNLKAAGSSEYVKFPHCSEVVTRQHGATNHNGTFEKPGNKECDDTVKQHHHARTLLGAISLALTTCCRFEQHIPWRQETANNIVTQTQSFRSQDMQRCARETLAECNSHSMQDVRWSMPRITNNAGLQLLSLKRAMHVMKNIFLTYRKTTHGMLGKHWMPKMAQHGVHLQRRWRYGMGMQNRKCCKFHHKSHSDTLLRSFGCTCNRPAKDDGME